MVELIEVGPAHTQGDMLAYVPDDRTIFTGDILFIGGTPIVWAGPLANWIAACDLMLGLDVDTVVPGHGPVTDKAGVAEVRDYLAFVDAAAAVRHDGRDVRARGRARHRARSSRRAPFGQLGERGPHRRQRRDGVPITRPHLHGPRHRRAVPRMASIEGWQPPV